MTPVDEYLRNIKLDPLTTSEDVKHLMNNFAYTTLKNLYNAIGREHSVDTILQTISNYKEKFHQCEEHRGLKADNWVYGPQE